MDRGHLFSIGLLGLAAVLIMVVVFWFKIDLRDARPQIERESFYKIVRPTADTHP